MEAIKEVLMKRDGLSIHAADQLIEEAREAFLMYLAEDDQEAAYNICEEFFGLEPDYLMDFI